MTGFDADSSTLKHFATIFWIVALCGLFRNTQAGAARNIGAWTKPRTADPSWLPPPAHCRCVGINFRKCPGSAFSSHFQAWVKSPRP